MTAKWSRWLPRSLFSLMPYAVTLFIWKLQHTWQACARVSYSIITNTQKHQDGSVKLNYSSMMISSEVRMEWFTFLIGQDVCSLAAPWSHGLRMTHTGLSWKQEKTHVANSKQKSQTKESSGCCSAWRCIQATLTNMSWPKSWSPQPKVCFMSPGAHTVGLGRQAHKKTPGHLYQSLIFIIPILSFSFSLSLLDSLIPILHPKIQICWKCTPLSMALQDVEEFVSSSEIFLKNVALHHLINNESFTVNGCH